MGGIGVVHQKQEKYEMNAVFLVRAMPPIGFLPGEIIAAHSERMSVREPALYSFFSMSSGEARCGGREVETRVMHGKGAGSPAGVPVGIEAPICLDASKIAPGSFADKRSLPNECIRSSQWLAKFLKNLELSAQLPTFLVKRLGHWRGANRTTEVSKKSILEKNPEHQFELVVLSLVSAFCAVWTFVRNETANFSCTGRYI